MLYIRRGAGERPAHHSRDAAFQIVLGAKDRLVVMPRTDIECWIVGANEIDPKANKIVLDSRDQTLVCQPVPAPRTNHSRQT